MSKFPDDVKEEIDDIVSDTVEGLGEIPVEFRKAAAKHLIEEVKAYIDVDDELDED